MSLLNRLPRRQTTAGRQSGSARKQLAAATVFSGTGHRPRRGVYIRLSPAERVWIAEDALRDGPAATARKYGISESTVRSIRDSYKRHIAEKLAVIKD